VFESYCSRCHSTNKDVVVVGPSLAGIALRGDTRIEGMDSENYIRFSIMNPGGYTVEGFPENTMPASLKEELTDDNLEAIIAYLMTLK
jgi:mono/diheme cytochrome c family protein